jgi:ABC-type transport system involved in Fe-S cluster assembly fused permease/ATPase subunit
MSKKNDKRLDDLISKVINTKKPQFDAEKWKQKFPEEFQTFKSRAINATISLRWTSILKNPIIKFAVAAMIILAIGLFMTLYNQGTKDEKADVTEFTQSPAQMLTMRALKTAYYNGGIEAVETQCDNAIEKLGLKSKKTAVQELLTDIDGV